MAAAAPWAAPADVWLSIGSCHRPPPHTQHQISLLWRLTLAAQLADLTHPCERQSTSSTWAVAGSEGGRSMFAKRKRQWGGGSRRQGATSGLPPPSQTICTIGGHSEQGSGQLYHISSSSPSRLAIRDFSGVASTSGGADDMAAEEEPAVRYPATPVAAAPPPPGPAVR